MEFIKHIRAKCKAAFIHFNISVVIFFIIATWMLFILYPSIFFNMSGGKQGFKLMLGVDIILGPMLTFLVFNPQKKIKEIIGDLLFVGLVQIVALSYGLYTVYNEHPKLIAVYDMGSAIVLNAREVKEDAILRTVDLSNLSKIEKIAVGGMIVRNGKQTYLNIHQAYDLMIKIDKIGRLDMKDEQDKMQLIKLEKQYGKVFVMSTVGKYTGAYIILDKNFNYIAKIGEKPTL